MAGRTVTDAFPGVGGSGQQPASVFLSYHGILGQESLEVFSETLERDRAISNAEQRRRVTNVMIELCQNILKHGVDREKQPDDRTSRSDVVVGRDDRGVFVKATAEAERADVMRVRTIIDELKVMSPAELDERYSNKLAALESRCGSAGLGLLDVAKAAFRTGEGRLMEVESGDLVGNEPVCQLGVLAYIS